MAKAADLLTREYPPRIYAGLAYDEDFLPSLVSACARTAERIDVAFPVTPGWWRRESEWFTEWDEILLEAFNAESLQQVWRRCLRWLEANRAFKLATAYAMLTYRYRQVVEWEEDWMEEAADLAQWLYPIAFGAVGSAAGTGISTLIMLVPGGQVAGPAIPYIISASTAAGAALGRSAGEMWAIGTLRVGRERARQLDEARAKVRAEAAAWEAA
jgi:hypothetical protein